MIPQDLGTLSLGAAEVVQIVRHTGVSQSIAEVAALLESDLRRWPDFRKVERVALHSAEGVIELMPTSDGQLYAFKYVNGHPGNTRLGLPTVMAFGALAEAATGKPLLLAELTLLTAIRTAAMSALAARTLARPDSRTMALIGNGAQAEFQALALRDLAGIRSLRLFDLDARATAKLQHNLRGQGLELLACADTAEAVRGADIVSTLTAAKARAAVIAPAMVEPGMHFNSVGGDCPGKTELHADVLKRASLFVEYAPQTRIEGEIQQLGADWPVTELWQVLCGQRPGRRSAGEVTVFDSVGFAVADHAALRFLLHAAQRLGIGRTMQLVPALADPKDLYGSLAAAAAPPSAGPA
ncbi:MAG TPA: ornithine cyclodeaminase [Rubrivivax sp.]|nr:ornithine cyclodeaminase [Rubrivivax sp.]HPO18312.1 ornithine cyclodeaminase [Rubrivivax sp.]